MKFNLCITGDDNDVKILSELMELDIGIELQSYGIKGVSSEDNWNSRIEAHKGILERFKGRISIHGPFIGIRYTYNDYLLREAVNNRMDLTYELSKELKPDIMVLHSGLTEDTKKFNFEELWFKETSEFWKREIKKYENLGVKIVIENLVEEDPSLLIKLHDTIDSDFFKLCLDVGHTNIFSTIPIAEWIVIMEKRLQYVHLHDNCGNEDKHLPVGKGNINFDNIFNKLKAVIPDIQITLEVEAETDVALKNIKYVIRKYTE